MARIFLSYKRDELDRVRAIVSALEAKGHTVWWDRLLDPRDTGYHLQIKREIDAADACIVAWSKLSVASEFVVSEAQEARDQKKLVSVLLDHDCKPPPPFNTTQQLDLSDWHGEAGHPEWRRVLGAASGERAPDQALDGPVDRVVSVDLEVATKRLYDALWPEARTVFSWPIFWGDVWEAKPHGPKKYRGGRRGSLEFRLSAAVDSVFSRVASESFEDWINWVSAQNISIYPEKLVLPSLNFVIGTFVAAAALAGLWTWGEFQGGGTPADYILFGVAISVLVIVVARNWRQLQRVSLSHQAKLAVLYQMLVGMTGSNAVTLAKHHFHSVEMQHEKAKLPHHKFPSAESRESLRRQVDTAMRDDHEFRFITLYRHAGRLSKAEHLLQTGIDAALTRQRFRARMKAGYVPKTETESVPASSIVSTRIVAAGWWSFLVAHLIGMVGIVVCLMGFAFVVENGGFSLLIKGMLQGLGGSAILFMVGGYIFFVIGWLWNGFTGKGWGFEGRQLQLRYRLRGAKKDNVLLREAGEQGIPSETMTTAKRILDDMVALSRAKQIVR